jgi:hypothetical protein
MAEENRAWLDRVAGARMEFDSEFSEVVAASSLTNQQWGLIMTAAEFQIEAPENPEQAELVPVTENLPAVMSQVEQLGEGMGMGGQRPASGGGLMDSIKDLFGGGGGGGGSEELVQTAEDLLKQYAEGFQERLEAMDRWEEVCALAADD